jgi:predicted component of type VI protein secretion system
MPPQLVALTEGPDLLLDKPILLLGRHQECDIQLNSRKISRRHCCIAQINNNLVIRDLCSTNGIRINGVRVAEGYLKPGDQVTIGNYHYRIQWEALAGDEGRPAAADDKHEGPPEPKLGGDDPLLSCEVPVPLAEPGGLPFGPARPMPQRKIVEKDPAPAPPGPPPPLIVPEDLGLAPLSGLLGMHDSKPPRPSS